MTEIAARLDQLGSAKNLQEKVDLLNTLTQAAQDNDVQRATEFNWQAIQLSWQFGKVPYPAGYAQALHHLGRLNQQLANYDLALASSLEALTLWEALGELEKQAAVHHTIANIYWRLSDYANSQNHLLKTLALHETLNNRDGKAQVLHDLGAVYVQQKEYEIAYPYLEEGLALAQELENHQLQADLLNQSALVYAARSDHESALRCRMASVQLNEQIHAPQAKAEALIHLGKIYHAQADYAAAQTYFEQALAIFRTLDSPWGIAQTLVEIGQNNRAQEQLAQAVAHFSEALEVAQACNAQQVLFACHQGLAALYEQQGDFATALSHYKQFHQIKESAVKEDLQSRLDHLEIARHVDSARKEAQIAHLRNIELEREIVERKRAESALEASSAKTQALYHLVRALASYDALPTMLQAVASTVTQRLPAAQVVLHTFDPETLQVTHFVEGRSNVSHPYHPPFERLANTLIGWAVTKEQPVLSTQNHPDPREDRMAQKQRAAAEIGTVIVIPMHYGGIMFGTLTAMNRTTDVDFTYEDLGLLRAMSSQIAIAISNVQRTEETMRLKEFNERIVQNVGEALLIEDTKGMLTFVNPAAETLLGYTEAELLGRYSNHVMFEAEADPLYIRVSHAPQGRQARYETTLRHKDGHAIPVIISAETLSEKGQVVGVLAAITDITEMKQAEATLRQRSTELELQNAELDAFAHTVAHDLRSPLTTIVGFSDLLTTHFDELPADRQRYGLASISESGHKMSEIINELLVMASVRSMETVDYQPLNMAELVAQVQKRLSYQIEQSHAEFSIPTEWPTAMGYAQWIEEVWANYISNAIKYGGTPPYIEIGFDECLSSPPPGHLPLPNSHIRFWVRDNGAGLSKDKQARLFLPFERLNQAHIDGHGLGLSIVRRIIQKLNGEVGVESQPGKGTMFFFTLPRQSNS